MRKIKRSEYLKEREAFHRANDCPSPRFRVGQDAMALDAVDYPWEPEEEEEEPWPEEVQALGPDGDDGFFYLLPPGVEAVQLHSSAEGWGSTARRAAAYREAARRWKGYGQMARALRLIAGAFGGEDAPSLRRYAASVLPDLGEEAPK